MLSSANCCPDGVGGAHVKLIDIIQSRNVGSVGDKIDITWQYYGVCVVECRHIYTGYLCSLMKSIMKIGHNYKYEQGKPNLEK